MAIGPSNSARSLDALFNGGSVVGLTDGALLERFLSGKGRGAELAFEALVSRHGPMVWGVCRRALANPTDADDAFQATFLILVRRANSIRVDDSLGRWLYGVSRRVAAKARADRDRRRRRESGGIIPDRPSGDASDRDKAETFEALDEEVRKLVEPFRSAIVLCDLGGSTHEQAALDLGCPVGTIKSRLARGRDRLRTRLVRRGVDWNWAVFSAGATAAPRSVIRSTVRLAMLIAAGGSKVVPCLKVGQFVLKNGVIRMVISVPFQWVVGTALVAAMGATGLTWASKPSGDRPASEAQTSDEHSGDKPVAILPKPPQVNLPRQFSRAGLPSRVASSGNGHPAATTQVPNNPAGNLPASPTMTPTEVAKSNIPREFNRVSMPDYEVQTPDVIIVEVLKALPDRPITGERLVRPDGKISLGYYGEVYVAGLTTTQIKEKVVLHLRKYLDDPTLGLETVKDGKTSQVAPAESTRVFVDVCSYNSKVYYVQGDVGTPGRLPVTGNETVLDAIQYAGGIIPVGDAALTIRLVRPAPPGACCEQILPVDLAAITDKGNSTTNYQMMPGDRLMVHRDHRPVDTNPTIDHEARIKELERKLEAALKKIEALEGQ